MNGPIQDLEAELAMLRPKSPPAEITAQLARELDAAPSKVAAGARGPAWAWLAGLSLAAACLALIAVRPTPLSPSTAPPTLNPNPNSSPEVAAPAEPASGELQGLRGNSLAIERPARGWIALRRVQAANYLVNAHDDGLIYSSATSPWRKVRYQLLDTSEWKGQDNTTVEVIVPRERTVLVPLNVH